MKQTITKISLVLLSVIMVISFAACSKGADAEGLWKDATYLKDTELGSGSKTVTVEVAVQDEKVTFKIKTDKEMVGDALLENELIAGDDSEYGLYIKKVNGITADYDKDKAYWAFYVDGEYAVAGIDSTKIDEGVTYRLEYTK